METYSSGMARVFFDKWFAAINADSGLPRVYDKKLTIITLCALMELDPAGIPESLRDGWPGIVAGALKVFKDLPKAVAGTERCPRVSILLNSPQLARCWKKPLKTNPTTKEVMMDSI